MPKRRGLVINSKRDAAMMKPLKYIGIDVNLMNIRMYILNREAKIEHYELLKDEDLTIVKRHDEYSMKLLKKIGCKAIVIDISILYNIHKTYELKRSRLQELTKKMPIAMERIMDKYSHREKRRVSDLIHKLIDDCWSVLVKNTTERSLRI